MPPQSNRPAMAARPPTVPGRSRNACVPGPISGRPRTGPQALSAAGHLKGMTYNNTGAGLNSGKVKAEATSPNIWFS
ncbi:hypothetical protein GCM10029978_027340 [Actinoallomurus acanthiterrae]